MKNYSFRNIQKILNDGFRSFITFSFGFKLDKRLEISVDNNLNDNFKRTLWTRMDGGFDFDRNIVIITFDSIEEGSK